MDILEILKDKDFIVFLWYSATGAYGVEYELKDYILSFDKDTEPEKLKIYRSMRKLLFEFGKTNVNRYYELFKKDPSFLYKSFPKELFILKKIKNVDKDFSENATNLSY